MKYQFFLYHSLSGDCESQVCGSNTCSAHQVCQVDVYGDYTCQCQEGRTGEGCGEVVPLCSGSLCPIGG